MPGHGKEKYRLYATISIEGSEPEGIEERVIENVLCKVFLPDRKVDAPALHFLPATREQEKKLRVPALFSVRAKLTQPDGSTVIITANKVHITSHKGTVWGPDLVEFVLIGEPWDLKVEHVRGPLTYYKEPRTKGAFRISPTQLLPPTKNPLLSYTGEVTAERFDQFGITLANGLDLTFDLHTRYWDGPEGETVMFDEVVAEFEMAEDTRGTTMVDDALDHLDDLLRIVSFVGEYPVACVGWQAGDSSSVTEFYRRRTVPSATKAPSVHDALVEYIDFKDFITSAYARFNETTPNAALRRALAYAVPDRNETIESAYIMLYAALETLVLFFRRQEGLEYIFKDDEQWQELNHDLRKWLKQHRLLGGDENKDTRQLVNEKLPELRRASFSAAFRGFCQRYGVDLSDLWAVTGNSKGDSLSAIRNKLVHGEVYDHRHYKALVGAGQHLRWSVYRMLFAMLGWPVERTKIRPEAVAHTFRHKTLERDRRLLSS
jgi:hypothetical protein